MPFKFIALFLFITSITACSASPTSTQASADTRACNALSYGNKNVDTQSVDSLFEQCMTNKKNIREKNHDDEVTLKWLEFFVTLFWSIDDNN